jgi:hypothetical protein
MNLRALPAAVAFYQAARDFCHLLETESANRPAWGRSLLATLARLYACAHILPEGSLLYAYVPDSEEPNDAIDQLDEFDVTDDQYKAIFSRLSELFGAHAGYWCYFDPTEPPDVKDDPVYGLLPDDLADIYRDIAPGVRGWETLRDDLLVDIVHHWKNPLFSVHWGSHAVDAMRALHPLVYDRGLPPNV